jgi:hypothetical protein
MPNNFEENEYPIYTNNLDVKINRKNVDEKYTIFLITTENSFFENNVLDASSEKFKAMSVAYYWGNRWFTMFKKGEISLDKFKISIQEEDESACVNEIDLFNTDEKSKENIQNVALAQLLVNTLKNRNNESFRYNNLTGNFYHKLQSTFTKKTFKMVNLRFYSHGKRIALSADTKTFSDYRELKHKKSRKPRYVIDKKTAEIRKTLKSDFETYSVFYDEGAISKKGQRTDFLNFTSNGKFYESKSGVIATFFRDVKEELGDFISISLVPFTKYNSYDNRRDDYESDDYKSFLEKRGICVVNTEVKNPTALQMEKSISDYLTTTYGLSEISKKREDGKYIIEIIHDKDSDFYASRDEAEHPYMFEEMNKPQDQHNLFTEKEIIQHITIENSAEKIDGDAKKDVMRNIIQELIVKGDICDRQISLVNWHEPQDWTFVRCGNGHGKKPYSFVYYKMSVSKEGEINFEEFDARNYPRTEEWICLDNIFRNYNKDNKKKRSSIECIVYNNLDCINVIYQTIQFTLPDIGELSQKLGLSDSQKTIERIKLLEYLEEFLNLHELEEKHRQSLDEFYQHIEKETSNRLLYKNLFVFEKDGTKKSFMRKTAVADFVNWVACSKKDEDGNPVLLHPQLKKNENLIKNFSSVLGIKSTELDGTFKYFVGKKKEALQTSLPCSCKIRDVIPWNKDGANPNGKILFDELAHMLTVEFVRNGQYTVIPFPVKYLNEYIRFREKDDSFEEES